MLPNASTNKGKKHIRCAYFQKLLTFMSHEYYLFWPKTDCINWKQKNLGYTTMMSL